MSKRKPVITVKEFLSLYRQYINEDKTKQDLLIYLKENHSLGKDKEGNDKWDILYSQYINRSILYIIKTKNIEILPALPEKKVVSDRLKKLLNDLEL